jgi:hypothetical protein
VRQRYERLRDEHLQGSGEEAARSRDGARFVRFGLVGLFAPEPSRGYVAQIHEARACRWGGLDPREVALRDVVHLVLGSAPRGFVERLNR